MQFSTGQLIRRSAWHYRSIAFAVAIGVAAATAVVCGALLVGDSMRGSLRALTLQRLGAIDGVVVPGGFFDTQRVASSLPPQTNAVPIILFARGVIETSSTEQQELRRAGNVQLIACEPAYWDLDTTGTRPKTLPTGDQVVFNRAAADELSLKIGDQVTVRLPIEQAVPADSPLGRRESESEGLPRLTVVDIVPNEGLARFGLQPSQANPLCVFLPLELVQNSLDRSGAANVLLISAANGSDPESLDRISAALQPGLADFGLRLTRVTQTFGAPTEQTIFDYYQLSSERLLLSDNMVRTISAELGDAQVHPVMTYLANGIELQTKSGETTSIPYSTITATDSSATLPLKFELPADTKPSGETNATEATADIPIVLNSWAAQRLNAEIGERLTIAYYEPETSAGREIEKTFAAVISDIVPLTRPSEPYRRNRPAKFDEPPTVYNDPDLTPTVPGVTDQDSISDWDLPFALDRSIDREDDDYWAEYRLTPKAYVPLAVGQKFFASRFGQTTSLRIPVSAAESLQDLEQRLVSLLRSHQAEFGYAILPIKAQQLAASKGTTPFDGLFLALSFFVIFAALLLVSLLFRLGMEQRATEYGTLFALGMPGTKVARMAIAEGAIVALPGALLGVVLGVGYAWLVLWGLRSWWVGAVTVPFLQFHWTWLSFLGGLLAGLSMAFGTIWVTARRLRRAEVSPLLNGIIPSGKASSRGNTSHDSRRTWLGYVAPVCFGIALLLGFAATSLSGPAQAGAFVGGGMLLLCGLLAAIYSRLTSPDRRHSRRSVAANYSLVTLAIRGVGRNPLRSTLSIGLMSVACFLIVSMSAFQMRPTESGVGGFDLIGQTAVPIYKNLGDPQVRQELLGGDQATAANTEVVGLRYRPGQDASCNNLYQATQPQVLGVPTAMAQRYVSAKSESNPGAVSFDWAAHAPLQADDDNTKTLDNPWQLLDVAAAGTEVDPVPVIIDQNTAMWSLQMRGGVGEVRGFTFDDGQTRYFRVVALLGNSVLQGSLLVSEQNFQTLFPAISGYSYFLVSCKNKASVDQVAQTYENRLGDAGMDMVSSRTVLSGMMAVQNTYLRTFQSLGALGLLLGTLGLAVVQLRNVLERRGELTVMRAIGFSRFRLASAVMLENTVLLVGGIGCGMGAALAAVIPFFVTSGTAPAIGEPLGFLGIVLIVGLLAGFMAVRRVLRMPLLGGF